jgi:hypothetical protein
MSTQYRLEPPFLYVPEEQDFPKAWEHFRCKLLNLSKAQLKYMFVTCPSNE